MFLQQRVNPCFNHLIGQLSAETEVELDKQFAGDNVVAAGACLNIGNLHAGRREELVTLVPLNRHQFVEHWRRAVYRVIGQMRIGYVPLHAMNGQVAGQ